MRITILGAGNVGAALGKGWSRARHTITFGVRTPDVKYDAAAREAGAAKVLSVTDAVKGAEIIVLAVPWQGVRDALQACEDLTGRTLIDVTNPLAVTKDGLGLEIGFTESGGETVARLAPGASVFKTMNQVGFSVMADAIGYALKPAMFVAGDDDRRKPAVLQLVGDLGFDAIDAGPLRIARLLEPYAMLWIDQAINRGAPSNSAFAFMRGKQA